MSTLLHSLGHLILRARLAVVLVWVGVLALAGLGAATLSNGTDNGFSLPGSSAYEALVMLEHTLPEVAGSSATAIVTTDGSVQDPAIKDAISATVTSLERLPYVSQVLDPWVARGGSMLATDDRAAMIDIQLTVGQTNVTPAMQKEVTEQIATLRSHLPAGAEVHLGGQMYAFQVPSTQLPSAVGIGLAFIILAITFSSLLLGILPLASSLAGVGLSQWLIYSATSLVGISELGPLIGIMLGLAVGIDYALFVTSRHRDQIRSGMDVATSIPRALATAGSAVVFAGTTVMIALLGLVVVGIPFLSIVGVAAAGAVLTAVLAALTLLPALLSFLGMRALPKRLRPAASSAVGVTTAKTRPGDVVAAVGDAAVGDTAAASPSRTATADTRRRPFSQRFFHRWVRLSTARPILTIVVVVVVLGSAAIPMTRMHLALPSTTLMGTNTEPRQTADLVAEHFGDGYNGPLLLTGVIISSDNPIGLMNDIAEEVRGIEGVASVPTATPNPTGDIGIVEIIPTGGPTEQSTTELVQRLQGMHDHFEEKYGVSLSVTGLTAVALAVSTKLGSALLPFGIVIIGLALVLLTMVFRSIWIPVTAALGYLFSVTSTLGIITMIWGFGWGAELVGVAKVGPVMSFLPIVVMGVLFGLSMDYEVFLVSRIREAYAKGTPAREAVQEGFMAASKVVTAAAAIMACVFLAFVPNPSILSKPIALALALGVLIDAFVVRMTLMPAVLTLLGEHAWYLPRSWDRRLPKLDVEGAGMAEELAMADWPEPRTTAAVVAADLALATPRETIVDGVSVRVEPGGCALVTGGTGEQRLAVLALLTGRATATGGRGKVDGLPLSVQASTIRDRSALAVVTAAGGVEDIDRALSARPRVLAIHGIDGVRDDAHRALLGELLTRARHRDPALALLVSVSPPDESARAPEAVAERERLARAEIRPFWPTKPVAIDLGGTRVPSHA